MKKLILALSILGFAGTASAGFMAEPYLGYGTGSYKTDSSSTTNTGYIVGAKIGFKFGNGAWVAADPEIGGGKTKPESGTETDYSSTQAFLDVGYDFPAVRAYAGYALMNELTNKDTVETKLKGGSTYKVGLGWRATPMFTVGVEYMMSTPKENEIGGVSGDLVGKNDLTFTALTLGYTFGGGK
jgi:hypothetical protein